MPEDKAAPRIDFAALNDALLVRAETLVPQWLSGGVRRGAEWVCGDLSGAKGGSLSVNLRTGVWKDFASEEAGADLVSLYAAIFCNRQQGKAARELSAQLGLNQFEATAAAKEAKPLKRASVWRAIVPVPDNAPTPVFKHWHLGEPSRVWAYRSADGAQLLGYVCRFEKADGGKEILPFTWCVDESDNRGTCQWHWKQWDAPRPLYLAAGRRRPELPIVVVEGEKCADAGHSVLGEEFDFVAWPGGAKAWEKADWGLAALSLIHI